MQINMREKSIIKENIIKYLDFKNVSKYKFYKKTGVSNGVLSQKTGLSEDNTLKFLSYYKDVNPEWLLTGKGEMLKDRDKGDKTPVALPAPARTEGIPLIPIDAITGFAGDDTQVMEYERFIIPTFKEGDFLISVRGSSMNPKYNSGDIVACKRLNLNTFFQWNKVYVLDTDQGALIKRVCEGADDEHVLIVSDNEKYKPFQLHRNEIHSLAVVLGVIRLE